MYNPNIDSTIASIQSLLGNLKTVAQSQQTSPASPFPNNFQEMIDSAVAKSLGNISNLQPQSDQQALANKPDPNSLEAKINQFAESLLTADQIKWLSDPTIISGLPLFLKSEKGKAAVGLIFSEYQDYVNR
jgi:hypothetical protein